MLVSEEKDDKFTTIEFALDMSTFKTVPFHGKMTDLDLKSRRFDYLPFFDTLKDVNYSIYGVWKLPTDLYQLKHLINLGLKNKVKIA